MVEVEAGIQWPELVDGLIAMQQGAARPWGIIQKQTGADRLTLGGALGANIHGRGLALRPIIGEVESFTLMDGEATCAPAAGRKTASCFGSPSAAMGCSASITRVRLRLMPRTKLERVVADHRHRRSDAGFRRAHRATAFSTAIASSRPTRASDTYLKKGVFSCYRPLPPDAPMPASEKELGEAQWRELYYYSHADTRRAYEAYTSYYLSTTGQRYWSDTSQLSVYIDDYHADLDRRLNAQHKGTEMITELYVPRPALPAFLAAVRADFRQHGVQLIYGTIRLIERDAESFLAWAREPWVCTVMNLHVDHTEDGIRKAADDFRRLIDRAIAHGGSYFLTYHRWASRAQVEACYPQMAEFLRLKRRHDPGEVFQSEWYRHYRTMFSGSALRTWPFRPARSARRTGNASRPARKCRRSLVPRSSGRRRARCRRAK